MKDLKLLSPAAAAASAFLQKNKSSIRLVKCAYIKYYFIIKQKHEKKKIL